MTMADMRGQARYPFTNGRVMKSFIQASLLFSTISGVNAYAAESESRMPAAAIRETRLAESPNRPDREAFRRRPAMQRSRLPARVAAAIVPNQTLTISNPGTYVLDQDLVLEGPYHTAVRILASDVTIDCQGKSLRPASRAEGNEGVFIQAALTGVIVTNCVIEDFTFGIRGGVGGTGLQALNNDIRNTGIGIHLAGNGTLIAGNRIVAMDYFLGPPDRGIGILLSSFDGTSDQPSTGAVIQDNVIVGIAGSQQAIGIEVVGSQEAKLLGNKILDLRVTGPDAMVHGISLRALYRWPKPPGQDVLTTGTIIQGNELMIRQHPLNTFAYATDGIALEAAECVGNLSIGFATPAFAGCLVASENIEVRTLFPTAVNGSQPKVPSKPGALPSTTATSASQPAVEQAVIGPAPRIRPRPMAEERRATRNAVQ
ncbi:hypothetical protein CSC74_03930 [Pseudoxanthomonas yeongjuensis]|uniref:right-handed parallel beta-helix repeat-containing protein n=1 Tax=Pseudoxanthomonas yeongjuensis TaxID=377616 RepID=UPI00139158CD|nr:right-handed parallel beta-helix repeat-containing protein [Pseudoxanthomonas yeongjuensis]KAF1718055.1 hypothetical protein CSC74_03930 [Pseudoxanthomonas yeongjuensis]